MTKHAYRSEEIPTAAAPFGSAAFTNGHMAETLVRVGEACTKACASWQEEMVRFAGDRLKKDGELGQSLSTCQSWSDLTRLQQEWAAAMARDYAEEATRLTQLATKLAQDSIAAWAVRSDGSR